tara:strand:- start:47 stop:262 length:216 start_codon:yes stop_codon:yes gene_type:complete
MKKPDKQINLTHGESLFIATSLERLRSDIRQAMKEHGDDDGGYDAHIRVLDKVISKFATAREVVNLMENYE